MYNTIINFIGTAIIMRCILGPSFLSPYKSTTSRTNEHLSFNIPRNYMYSIKKMHPLFAPLFNLYEKLYFSLFRWDFIEIICPFKISSKYNRSQAKYIWKTDGYVLVLHKYPSWRPNSTIFLRHRLILWQWQSEPRSENPNGTRLSKGNWVPKDSVRDEVNPLMFSPLIHNLWNLKKTP